VTWLPWSTAMDSALYGPGGFFRSSQGPSAHFRTSVHASPLFARALCGLLRAVDDSLGHPPELDVVDVGAGHGELLSTLITLAPADLASRLRLTAVERADRPRDLPETIGWTSEPPRNITGLLLANEWLDNVPLDIAELDDDGVPRLVEVNTETGEERLGAPVEGEDEAWLTQWWPDFASSSGLRAEIGRPRDAAWSSAVSHLCRGLAVAVDYAHTRSARPPFGTLAAYRSGRETRPIPDGSCDLTCHVALDACLSAATEAAAQATQTIHTLWTTQRNALHALGVSGTRPPLTLASTDPAGYVRALSAAGEAAELTDPHGLGGFVWGVQAVGIPVPPILTP
jgi:SAM-dependent MidA family methyltransferase